MALEQVTYGDLTINEVPEALMVRFGAAAAGVATANAVADTTGAADGTAGYFRVLDSNAVTRWDGSVTASGGGDMELNTTTISTGVAVSMTSWTVTMPSGE